MSEDTALREVERRMRQTIARNIKAERKALDLSGVETAARCGLNLRHIQQIESSESNITLATLAALSVGLGIEATDLLLERPPDQTPDRASADPDRALARPRSTPGRL